MNPSAISLKRATCTPLSTENHWGKHNIFLLENSNPKAIIVLSPGIKSILRTNAYPKTTLDKALKGVYRRSAPLSMQNFAIRIPQVRQLNSLTSSLRANISDDTSINVLSGANLHGISFAKRNSLYIMHTYYPGGVV